MIEVQRKLRPALKDHFNGFTQSGYATLNLVMEACGEALIEAGIWVTLYPVAAEGDGKLEFVTKLVHAESGKWQESLIVMPLAKCDPQAYGSALTYARRYGLSAMVGLVTEDDEANLACKGISHGLLNHGIFGSQGCVKYICRLTGGKTENKTFSFELIKIWFIALPGGLLK